MKIHSPQLLLSLLIFAVVPPSQAAVVSRKGPPLVAASLVPDHSHLAVSAGAAPGERDTAMQEMAKKKKKKKKKATSHAS